MYNYDTGNIISMKNKLTKSQIRRRKGMSFLNMPKRNSVFTKFVSALVVQSFILSSIAFAAPLTTPTDLSKPQETVTNPEKIVIPREAGIVKAKFTGNSGKLIIHIQDAHCNYEAQTNIAKILENMVKNYNVSLVSVEGADGVIDTTWFKAFPDDEVRKEVADYFMRKGEITGPEFLSITTDYPIKLFGAETRSYYIENLNAFTSSYPLKESTEKYYNQIKTILNRLKNFIYSDELKTLDAKMTDYEAKKIQFNDYIRFLQSMAEAHKINLRQYDNLFKLVSVLIYEKRIDFSVTDKERSALIDELSKAISKDALTELVTQSLSFKVGKISSAEYYGYLKTLALKNEIELAKKYPNLYNYIIYNSIYSKIDNEKLFKDIKELETAIKEKLFQNDDQRTLEKLSRHIDTLIGMVDIKLLNGDFDYYKEHKEEFSHEAFADFIKNKTVQYGLSYEVEAPDEAVSKAIPKLEDFYSIAVKRDKALVDNTLNAMKKEKQDIAVLVTGGFHSEGIAKLLEKQGVSYIVVCPTITKDLPTPYIQILTNQRTPLEDILKETATPEMKKAMLAPPLATWLANQKKTKYVRSRDIQSFFNEITGKTIIPNLEDILEKEATVRRVIDIKEGWMERAVEGWLKRAYSIIPANQQKLARDPDVMLSAYRLAMEARLKTLISDERDVKKIVDEIFSSDLFRQAFETAFRKTTPNAPAITASGNALTDAKHRGEPGKETESVNGVVRNLILANHRAYALAKSGKPYEGADKDIRLLDVGAIAHILKLDQDAENRLAAVREIAERANVNFIVLEGLTKELTKLFIVESNLLLHPGRGRQAIYIDEADLLYLLDFDKTASKTLKDIVEKDSVGLLKQAIAHEKAHIDNPGATEEEVEAMAASHSVRLAFLLKDMSMDNLRVVHYAYSALKNTYKSGSIKVPPANIAVKLRVSKAIATALRDKRNYELRPIEIITSEDDKVRDTTMEDLFERLDTRELIASGLALENFVESAPNLYHKVRACALLNKLYDKYLYMRLDLREEGSVDFEIIEQLGGGKKGEFKDLKEAITAGIKSIHKQMSREGYSKTLFTYLAAAYDALMFEHLGAQVEKAIHALPENAWMFDVKTLDDYKKATENKLKVPQALLTPDAKGKYPLLHVTVPVRIELSSSVAADIFFLAMDRPEKARVTNVSVDLAIHGKGKKPTPPVNVYMRVIDEPLISLCSMDLGKSKKVTALDDLFNFGNDDLGTLKASIIASGVVPYGLKGANVELKDILAALVGEGKGIEFVTSVHAAGTPIPRGSGLAVSTMLLVAGIDTGMKFSGQMQHPDETITVPDKEMGTVRTVFGEGITGGGGGWQDSGGQYGGIKICEARVAQSGDPEYGVSRGRLLPSYRTMTQISPEAQKKFVESMVLVHSGATQDVGPVLEDVTRQYLLRSGRAWNARLNSERLFAEQVEALVRGDIKRVGEIEDKDWINRITIVPLGDNGYIDEILKRLKAEFGDDLWGADSTGCRGGAGHLFFVNPERKAEFIQYYEEIVPQIRAEMEKGFPIPVKPTVYDFALNNNGITARILTDDEAVIPDVEKEKDIKCSNCNWEGYRDKTENTCPQCGADLYPLSSAVKNARDYSQTSNAVKLEAYSGGATSLENNRRLIEAVEPATRKDTMQRPIDPKERARLRAIGNKAIKDGKVIEVTFAAGAGARFTGGEAAKPAYPILKIGDRYYSFAHLQGLKTLKVARDHDTSISHILHAGHATDEALIELARRENNFGLGKDLIISQGLNIGQRAYPKEGDLRFARAHEGKKSAIAEGLRDQQLENEIGWAKDKGEGAPFIPEGRNKLNQFNAPGHFYWLSDIILSGALGRALEGDPRAEYIFAHNVDNLLATIDDETTAMHIESGKAISAEVAPITAENVGGGLAWLKFSDLARKTLGMKTDRALAIMEACAATTDQDESKPILFNVASYWVTINAVLKEIDITRDEVIGVYKGDERALQAVQAKLFAFEQKFPTYITLRPVVEDLGGGNRPTVTVAQFEKFWGDTSWVIPYNFIISGLDRSVHIKEIGHRNRYMDLGLMDYLLPELPAEVRPRNQAQVAQPHGDAITVEGTDLTPDQAAKVNDIIFKAFNTRKLLLDPGNDPILVRTVTAEGQNIEVYVIPELEACNDFLITHPGRGGVIMQHAKKRIYMSPTNWAKFNNITTRAQEWFLNHEADHIILRNTLPEGTNITEEMVKAHHPGIDIDLILQEMAEASASVSITLSVGASKIGAAAVTTTGNVFSRLAEIETPKDSAEALFVGIMAQVGFVSRQVGTANVVTIGVSLPGPLNQETGIVENPLNIPFENYPLKHRLENAFAAKYGRPVEVRVLHDGDAGAVGEINPIKGTLPEAQEMTFFNWGSGIGSGVIHNGKSYWNDSNLGTMVGEIGHMVVRLPNGQFIFRINSENNRIYPVINRDAGEMYLEDYLAGGPIRIDGEEEEPLVELMRSWIVTENNTQGPERWEGLLNKLGAETTIDKLTLKDINEAARNGSELASELIERSGRELGRAYAAYVKYWKVGRGLLFTDNLVIGAGVANIGRGLETHLVNAVKEGLRQELGEKLANPIKVYLSTIDYEREFLAFTPTAQEPVQPTALPSEGVLRGIPNAAESSIKTVILDAGNVIYTFDYSYVARRLHDQFGVDYQTAMTFFERRSTNPENPIYRYEHGVIKSKEEFITAFCETLSKASGREVKYALPGGKPDIEGFEKMFNSVLTGIYTSTDALISTLVKKGYDVRVLTTINPIHLEHWISVWKLDSRIGGRNHIYASYERGFDKSDARSYLEIAREAGVSQQNCLFVDDLPSNVEVARSKEVGMQANWFNPENPETSIASIVVRMQQFRTTPAAPSEEAERGIEGLGRSEEGRSLPDSRGREGEEASALPSRPTEPMPSPVLPEIGQMVDDILAKYPVSGTRAQEIVTSLKQEATGLQGTYTDILKKKMAGETMKEVVLIHDTALDPEVNIGGVARALEQAITTNYPHISLTEVRGTGQALLEKAGQVIRGFESDGKTNGKEFVVITIKGKDDLSETFKKLGKVLEVDATGGRYIPLIGIYSVALRIALGIIDDKTVMLLNAIAYNGEQMPFTIDDLQRSFNFIIKILPKIDRVDPSEAAAAYKAAEQVLRAL